MADSTSLESADTEEISDVEQLGVNCIASAGVHEILYIYDILYIYGFWLYTYIQLFFFV